MTRPSIETTLRLRIKNDHETLGAITSAIAKEGSLVRRITTLRIGLHHIVREVTFDTLNEKQTAGVVEAVRAVTGVVVEDVVDRTFERHRGGIVAQQAKVYLQAPADLEQVYAPGLSRLAHAIQRNPELALDFTSIPSTVGIFSDGSSIPGGGNVGPVAAMPLLEGAATVCRTLAGLNAVPMLVHASDPEAFVEAIERVAPTFGAIYLTNLRAPNCFRIEELFREKLRKPVLVDAHHATPTVVLATMINACRAANVDLKSACVGQVGLGPVGIGIARLVQAYGVGSVVVADTSKEATAAPVAKDFQSMDLDALLRRADVVVASSGQKDLLVGRGIRKGQVILALSYPDAEIDPLAALDAGAALALDGTLVTDALVFPGLLKGALDSLVRRVTNHMLIAAAEATAGLAEPGDFLPSALSPSVHAAVAESVIRKAKELHLSGMARLT